MYGTLLAFAIAVTIVAIIMAVVRLDATEPPPAHWWPATTIIFISGVTLIGAAATGLAS